VEVFHHNERSFRTSCIRFRTCESMISVVLTAFFCIPKRQRHLQESHLGDYPGTGWECSNLSKTGTEGNHSLKGFVKTQRRSLQSSRHRNGPITASAPDANKNALDPLFSLIAGLKSKQSPYRFPCYDKMKRHRRIMLLPDATIEEHHLAFLFSLLPAAFENPRSDTFPTRFQAVSRVRITHCQLAFSYTTLP